MDDIHVVTLPTSFSNFDFEQGWTGWTPIGPGGQIAASVSDGNLPAQGTQAYQTARGSGVITAAEAALTNQLYSGTFAVTAGTKKFSARLFGGADAGLYVALVSAANGTEICRLSKRATGTTWETCAASFTLSANTTAYLKIVDTAGGATGYFAVDDLAVADYTFDNFDF